MGDENDPQVQKTGPRVSPQRWDEHDPHLQKTRARAYPTRQAQCLGRNDNGPRRDRS